MRTYTFVPGRGVVANKAAAELIPRKPRRAPVKVAPMSRSNPVPARVLNEADEIEAWTRAGGGDVPARLKRHARVLCALEPELSRELERRARQS